MITILGVGGANENALVKPLDARKHPLRPLGRDPRETGGVTEPFATDLTDKDQTIRGVAGSRVEDSAEQLKTLRSVYNKASCRISRYLSAAWTGFPRFP